MTPDIQAPFLSLLLLFPVLTVADVTTLTTSDPINPRRTTPVSSTQSSPMSSPTKEISWSITTTLLTASSPAPSPAASPGHDGASTPTSSPAPSPAASPGHNSAPSLTSSPAPSPTASPGQHGASSPTSSDTLSVTTSSASSSMVTSAHRGTSSTATMTPVSKGTPSSVPSSETAPTAASHITRTAANSPSIALSTSSNPKTSQQLSVRVSLYFLSFHITNLQFNSSLENPQTSYYQELRRSILDLILQIYKQRDFLGLSEIKFRPGSVVVELTLAFREGTTAEWVKAQFSQLEAHAASYNLTISGVSVYNAPFPSSAQAGSGVPGWGIALLVLVCVLVALAIIYLIALVVCQCGQKKCEQLDVFPALDAYHPMSEYSTYHTHGRYVPPGSTKRSPYEEVSADNGGSNLSYTNLAATSANL